MPKDAWAKDRSRSIGKRAVRSGEFFPAKSQVIRKKRKISGKPSNHSRYACPHCGACKPKLTTVKIKGAFATRQDCGVCGKFIKWGRYL